MEKEQILSTLNEQLGETNFSERTINDYVDAFIPETEENPDFEKHVGFLRSLYGNYSADVAKQVNEAKAKLKPPTEAKDQPDDTRYADLAAKFEKLMESHVQLAESLAKKESKQAQEQFLTQVKAEMQKQGANDAYVLKNVLRGRELDVKKSASTIAKELMADYDSEFAECHGNGAAPRSGKLNGGSGPGKNAASEFFESKNRHRKK